MEQLNYLKVRAWATMCLFLGLANVMSLQLNVLYKEIPALQGRMCLQPHVVFNTTAVSNDIACVNMCIKHTSCHSIFYDVIKMFCVGCARRYAHASETDVSGGAIHEAGKL